MVVLLPAFVFASMLSTLMRGCDSVVAGVASVMSGQDELLCVRLVTACLVSGCFCLK